MFTSKKFLFLSIITIVIVVFLLVRSFDRANSTSVLSASKVNTSTGSASTRINCNYFQASWIQFKRDFMETQSKNYSSSDSANLALEVYLKSYQDEAKTYNCLPPHF